jgi:hypothetical protein
MPSFDADTTAALSNEKAMLLTELVWPLSICETAPVDAFQNWTVLSFDPDATILASGEKTTA